MPRKISNQVKSKAVGLYRSGMTLREASEEVGVSYETIRRFVQEAGGPFVLEAESLHRM